MAPIRLRLMGRLVPSSQGMRNAHRLGRVPPPRPPITLVLVQAALPYRALLRRSMQTQPGMEVHKPKLSSKGLFLKPDQAPPHMGMGRDMDMVSPGTSLSFSIQARPGHLLRP